MRFALPAAAEAAGYRACLRCRPYRCPQPAFTAGPDLVCRAVQLILDGALDSVTEPALAGRLGVSPRHLRRLFGAHLGVTPDGLARSARTHFARRLLDDTDLSITEIAFGAGFGSVRQFNRSCVEVFRMAPNELRARRRRADRLVADGGLLLRLPFAGPLDWDAVLTQLAEQVTPGVEHISAGSYRRTIEVEGHPGALELTAGGPEHLLLRLHLPRWHELVHLVGRARRLASLDLDLDAALRRFADDPSLGPLVAQRPGLRPPGTWDPFEVGARAVLEDDISADASPGVAQMVQRFGRPVAGLSQLGLTHLFRTAAALATALPHRRHLHDPGPSHERLEALVVFAQAVASGQLKLDRSLPLERLLADLTTLGGLSQRAAGHLALRLGEPDAYAGSGASANEDSGRWSPWRAIATTHLDLHRRLASQDRQEA